MVPPLQPTWATEREGNYAQARIKVRNLQSTITGPHDAWGRPGRPQPILITAEVSLRQPFGASSTQDAVAVDTVHYGLLSKAILKALEGPVGGLSLFSVLEIVWQALTGRTFDNIVMLKPAFLSLSVVQGLRVRVELPKASLLGSSVSLTGWTLYGPEGKITARSMVLDFNELRVPTLIGVNDNERAARQVVVANVGIENYEVARDAYVPLERLITETMADSSYETLEALASDILENLSGYLTSNMQKAEGGYEIKVGLEKPTAVVLADAACVELTARTPH